MKLSARYYYAGQWEVQRLRDLYGQFRVSIQYYGLRVALMVLLRSRIDLKVER